MKRGEAEKKSTSLLQLLVSLPTTHDDCQSINFHKNRSDSSRNNFVPYEISFYDGKTIQT
jgi:hypothetical protein